MQTTLFNLGIGTLYADHFGWLNDLLRRKLGCAHKAEDFAQDTFLKVIASHAATAIREPRAFLRTIAHDLVVSHWRRLELERAYVSALEAQGPSLSPSPEDRVQALNALACVADLMDRLPPNVGQSLVWSQIDGLTYVEIAERLDVSERMVKKYMARAMHELLLVDA